MEISQLRISITDADLNGLLGEHLPPGLPIQDLKVGITPQGILIQGVYPLFVKVAFETVWEPAVQSGKVTARLAQFKAMGVPGNMFKGAVLKQIGEAVQGKDWIGLVDDTLILDVDRLLQRSGVSGKANLQRVSCETGQAVLEAGTA